MSGLLLTLAAVIAGSAGVVTRSSYLGIVAVGLMLSLLLSEFVLGRPSGTPGVDAARASRGQTGSPMATASEGERPSPPAPKPALLVRVPPDLEPETVLAVYLGACGEICHAVAAHLWLEDPGTATLRRVGAVGPMAPTSQPLPQDTPVLGEALSGNSATLAAVARVRRGESEGVLWRYAVPVSAGETRGVVGLDLECEGEPDRLALTDATAPLAASLAGALALHVARVEGRVAAGLNEVARELSRLLDPEEVVQTALRRAVALSDAATGSVMLLDDATGVLRISASVGLPEDVVEQTTVAEGEGIAGWVLSSRQPLLVEDLGQHPSSGRRHGIRSAASVPIADDDGVLGVINVGSRVFPARFTESHLASLETLGKQTAVALRNARAVASSRNLYLETLQALAVALETKDPYSRGSTERVADAANGIARVLGLAGDDLEALHVASLLHDIGMSAAGDPMSLKRRPLTTVEHGLLKLHPQIAADILREIPALRHVVPIVYHHHEWYDGRGYLGGLEGEEIPLGARVLAVADAFVAMTSERPYRAAMAQTEALAELKDKAGSQFDPAVVAALEASLGTDAERSPDRA